MYKKTIQKNKQVFYFYLSRLYILLTGSLFLSILLKAILINPFFPACLFETTALLCSFFYLFAVLLFQKNRSVKEERTHIHANAFRIEVFVLLSGEILASWFPREYQWWILSGVFQLVLPTLLFFLWTKQEKIPSFLLCRKEIFQIRRRTRIFLLPITLLIGFSYKATEIIEHGGVTTDSLFFILLCVCGIGGLSYFVIMTILKREERKLDESVFAK